MRTPTAASTLDLEIALMQHQPAIESARRLIFWAGFIYPAWAIALFAIFVPLTGPSIFVTGAFAWAFGIASAVCGAHIAVAWWAKHQPLAATGVAVAIYLLYMVGVVMIDSAGGWLIPLIGLFVLGRAFVAAFKLHRCRRQVATRRMQSVAA
jgi:hypothetical protein